MSSWLTSTSSSPVVDKFDALVRIQRLCPSLSAEARRTILRELEQEIRSWSPYQRNLPTFETDWVLTLERLCREARECSLNPLERRMRESRDPWVARSLTRRDVLRDTTTIALDYDFPTERRNSKMELDETGDIALVDVTRLHPSSQFCIAKFDWSFLPDLKRLHHALRLKDGRLVVKTFREDSRGVRSRYEMPLVSIVAAKKVGRDYDCVFNTAYPANGNPLDLRSANTVVPAYEYSAATRIENAKFNGDDPQGHDRKVFPIFEWLDEKASTDPTPPRATAKTPSLKQQEGENDSWSRTSLNAVRPKNRTREKARKS